jgi:acyl-CoA thioester hydrolase
MPRVYIERFTVPAESIDINGHVNNVEYVRWMQAIATAHSHEQGWTVARYIETRTTWVIRSHFIEYFRPLFRGEEVVLATWVAGMQTQASPRKYRFVCARDGKPVAVAETLWTYCDAMSGRPIDIPNDLREAFPVVTDEAEIAAALAAA